MTNDNQKEFKRVKAKMDEFLKSSELSEESQKLFREFTKEMIVALMTYASDCVRLQRLKP